MRFSHARWRSVAIGAACAALAAAGTAVYVGVRRRGAQPGAESGVGGEPAAGRGMQHSDAGEASSGWAGDSLVPATTAASHVVGGSCDEVGATQDQLTPTELGQARELFAALKLQANAAFQRGDLDGALQGYQDCLDVATAVGSSDAEIVLQSQIVRSNVALVFYRQQRYRDAHLVATFLLQDAQHAVRGDLKVKVLYRRGLASKELGDVESALADFRAALHFSPNGCNPLVAKEIAVLERCK